MNYLYRALTRQTGHDPFGPQMQTMPPGRAHDRASALNVPRPPAATGQDRTTQPPSAVGKEEIPFYPDIISDSPAVRQHPELFYALSSEPMTRDRILALEQIRVLRSRVMEFMHVRNVRTLLVTSAVAEEGKTITSINLALALSQVQGMRVLLVDTDLRKPSIARVLGLSPEHGLLRYLQSEITLAECIQRLNSRLSFIPARRATNSVELLHSPQMSEFIASVRSNFNLVIFDAPPLYCIADSQILTNYVDGVMMCIRAGHTSSNLVAEASAMVSSKLIGTVLVGGERQPHGYAYSNYSGGEKD